MLTKRESYGKDGKNQDTGIDAKFDKTSSDWEKTARRKVWRRNQNNSVK